MKKISKNKEIHLEMEKKEKEVTTTEEENMEIIIRSQIEYNKYGNHLTNQYDIIKNAKRIINTHSYWSEDLEKNKLIEAISNWLSIVINLEKNASDFIHDIKNAIDLNDHYYDSDEY